MFGFGRKKLEKESKKLLQLAPKMIDDIIHQSEPGDLGRICFETRGMIDLLHQQCGEDKKQLQAADQMLNATMDLAFQQGKWQSGAISSFTWMYLAAETHGAMSRPVCDAIDSFLNQYVDEANEYEKIVNDKKAE